MSSCGLEFRFYFEIGVILVIALIVYIFVFIALGVGKFLWNIQEKLNRHELSLGDRNYDLRQSKVQQTTHAPYTDYDNVRSRKATTQSPCTDCDNLRSRKATMEEDARKLRDEKSEFRSALVNTSSSIEALILELGTTKVVIKEGATEITEEIKADVKKANESIGEIRRKAKDIADYLKRLLSS